MSFCKISLSCLLIFMSLVLAGAVKLPAIFSDHAVLAKRNGVPVFGTAAPGEKVTVKFNGQEVSTVADSQGNFLVRLDLADFPEGPFELHVNDRVIKDVLVGEVFLASGQSNMEFTFSGAIGLAEAQKLPANRKIRHFKVGNRYSLTPIRTMSGQWVTADSTTLPKFSAIGYFFARKLHRELNVPVGIVNSSWGGTPIECWMSEESLKPFPVTVKVGNELLKKEQNYPQVFRKFLEDISAWQTKYGRDDIPVKFPGSEAEWRPHTSHGGTTGNGVLWMRNRISISPQEAEKGFQLRLNRFYSPAQIFIGKIKVAEVSPEMAWHNDFLVTTVPGGKIPAGEHEVLLRYFSNVDFMYFPQPHRYGSYVINDKGWEIYREKDFGKPAGQALKERPVHPGGMPSPVTKWSRLYNAMIYPLIPYRFSGVIWYQGEANAGRPAEYAKIFPAMISDWREKFADPAMPFLFCQLASYRLPVSDPGNTGTWPKLRDAQKAALNLGNTGMAVLTDAGEALDIHSRNKLIPGERLADLAMKIIYGKEDIPAYPEAVKAVAKGDKVEISFVNGKLLSRTLPDKVIHKSINGSSAKLVRRSPRSSLESFALCGADGKWFWADRAEIAGDKVVVYSSKVPRPVKVRFAYTDYPLANLFNEAGLPAVPFEMSITR
ncbi:MAG: hypothetical protein IKD23_00420 [Lentisphaeria bacterium]|nr:hypothetical protein [Lentisphaeria bacterium]